MFKVKKYKIGDIVKCNNKWWEIKDINTNGVPVYANDLIALGLAEEKDYYAYILVLLTIPCSKEIGICVYLNKIYEENKDMGDKKDLFKYGTIYFGNEYVGNVSRDKISLSKNDPVIVDYKVINNTVVIFTFSDGTTEKTVCNHEFDEFELWRAVELAICKKKFGGTKAYHNAVNNAIKQIENIDAKKKADAEEKERIANRKAKYQQRKAKRMAKKRQEQIDMMSEAFLKSMLAYDEAMDANLSVPDENVDNASDSAVENVETK